MFESSAHLSVRRIPLSCLQVTERVSCHPEKVVEYTALLTAHPGMDMEPIITIPSPTHAAMFAITNGKHRFLSYILAGREDIPGVVVEEEEQSISLAHARYVHELERLLQSCLDFIGKPVVVGSEHKEAYAAALCKQGLGLLRVR